MSNRTAAECDRSFTRSDALAKHMRTVHETEPPRPSDPIPKHHPSHPSHSTSSGGGPGTSTPSKPTRLRLVVNQSGGASNAKKESLPATPTTAASDGRDPDEEDPTDANNIAYMPGFHPLTGQAGYMIHWPSDIAFSEHEKQMRADQLRRLLRRQLSWAELEQDGLKRECADLERRFREEWVGKEGVLENVMEGELAVGEVKRRVSLGVDDRKGMKASVRRLELRDGMGRVGEEPWWRKNGEMKGGGSSSQPVGELSPDAMQADPTLMAAKELLEMSAGKGHDERMGGGAPRNDISTDV